MDGGPVTRSESTKPPKNDFSERLVEAFFRRWYLYLIPVALFAAIGVNSTEKIVGDYSSRALLSATSNPYVDAPDIRGTAIAYYESPAQGTARQINEQLGSDAFIDDVAARAGLNDAIDSGVITPGEIRSRLGASAAGQNNLSVSASWTDPDTAYRLASETVAAYRSYLTDLAVADSADAVTFWTQRKESAAEEVQSAVDALSSYLAELPPLPPGQERTTEQVLALQRLDSAIDRASSTERDAQSAIDEAQFAAAQAVSNSARALFLIDPPEVSAAPTPVRRDQMISIATFTLMGVVIALAALIFSTAADRSVRTRGQLQGVTGIDNVVTIPRLKQLRKRRRKSTSASVEAA